MIVSGHSAVRGVADGPWTGPQRLPRAEFALQRFSQEHGKVYSKQTPRACPRGFNMCLRALNTVTLVRRCGRFDTLFIIFGRLGAMALGSPSPGARLMVQSSRLIQIIGPILTPAGRARRVVCSARSTVVVAVPQGRGVAAATTNKKTARCRACVRLSGISDVSE